MAQIDLAKLTNAEICNLYCLIAGKNMSFLADSCGMKLPLLRYYLRDGRSDDSIPRDIIIREIAKLVNTRTK